MILASQALDYADSGENASVFEKKRGALEMTFYRNEILYSPAHRLLRLRILLAAIGIVVSVPIPTAVRGEENADAELKQALTFHASFDQGADADFGLGNKSIFTAESYKARDNAKPGLHNADVSIAAGKGRYGSALEFRAKNTAAIFYPAEKNVDYRQRDWNGTVSFWLSLDPNQDLAPGFCDPIQVTDTEYNDAALWVDFSKDERPRHFRLGVFGDLLAWNPNKLSPDKFPDFNRRLITVTEPPFARGMWTHIAFTFSGLNAEQPGSAKLYLNGKLLGTTEPIKEPFTWDISRAAIRLGLNYTGLFDELSVFNRALTDAEIRTLYGLDSGVSTLRP
jgi:hypothetical protein